MVTILNTFLNGANNPYHLMVDLPASQRPWKFVATAQGSQCGINVFNGSNVVMAEQNTYFAKHFFPLLPIVSSQYWLDTKIKSLPTSGTATILDYKFERRIRILGIGFGWKTTREKHPSNPAGFVNWDGTPGGTQDIVSRAAGALTSGLEFSSPWYATPIVLTWAGLSLNVNDSYRNFSFISTTSSLDAPEGTDQNTAFNYVQFGLGPARVDKFVAQNYYANKYNINHTDYTARNAKWMYNEMEDISQPISCDNECDPASLNLVITGPPAICSTAVYTVLNVPSSATVSWPSSPYYTVTPLNSNSSQVSISFAIPGAVTISPTVNISGSCYAPVSITLTKTLRMGPPTANTFVPYITHGGNSTYMSNYCNKLVTVCSNSTRQGGVTDNSEFGMMSISPYNYCASGYIIDNNATSITWSLLQKSPGTFHGYYNFTGNQFNVGINLNYPTEWVVLRCTRTNECGSSTSDYKFFAENTLCIGSVEEKSSAPDSEQAATILEASPNPSRGDLKVSLVRQGKPIGIRQIVILNKMGLLLYNQSFNTGQSFQNIRLRVPATDIYTLKVFDGTQWHTNTLSLLK